MQGKFERRGHAHALQYTHRTHVREKNPISHQKRNGGLSRNKHTVHTPVGVWTNKDQQASMGQTRQDMQPPLFFNSPPVRIRFATDHSLGDTFFFPLSLCLRLTLHLLKQSSECLLGLIVRVMTHCGRVEGMWEGLRYPLEETLAEWDKM